METVFTPVESLAGGVLIGLAAVLLIATHGRVFGATGILAGFLSPLSSGDWVWRGALIAGMISGPLAYLAVAGEFPAIEVPVSTGLVALGGLIVGIGVTYGSGCTSGHGVCGTARLSPRSIVATATFILTTALTVYVMRHVLGA